jgi:hypothetical protein
MKIKAFFIFIVVLFGLAGNSSATSPMPEEVMPVPMENICTVHIVRSVDLGQEVLKEENSSNLKFESSMSRKDVLEKLTQYMNKKLYEDNISEFKVDCKFYKK